MSKRRSGQNTRHARHTTGQRKKSTSPLPFAALALVAVVAGAAAFWAFAGGGSSGEDEADQPESGVEVIQGRIHTIHHSHEPLPSADQPRSDGQPTLIWFSAPWCHFCSQMSGFAHETAEEFAGDVYFVEKSVELERDAVGRYGVRGTPTFVLIDAAGEPVARFGFQPDAESFRATIDEALQEAG